MALTEDQKAKAAARQKAYRDRRRAEDPERWSQVYRKQNVRRLFGLTLEQVEEMRLAQENKCKICGCEMTQDKRITATRMAIDHDHSTGQVRGLLCHPCNTGLGLFRDSPDIMLKAIAYLEDANHGT